MHSLFSNLDFLLNCRRFFRRYNLRRCGRYDLRLNGFGSGFVSCRQFVFNRRLLVFNIEFACLLVHQLSTANTNVSVCSKQELLECRAVFALRLLLTLETAVLSRHSAVGANSLATLRTARVFFLKGITTNGTIFLLVAIHHYRRAVVDGRRLVDGRGVYVLVSRVRGVNASRDVCTSTGANDFTSGCCRSGRLGCGSLKCVATFVAERTALGHYCSAFGTFYFVTHR